MLDIYKFPTQHVNSELWCLSIWEENTVKAAGAGVNMSIKKLKYLSEKNYEILKWKIRKDFHTKNQCYAIKN